jgi:signal peptidase
MKILKIIYYIFAVFIALIAFLFIVSVLPVKGNISFKLVESASMEPNIKMGSIVLIKPAQDYKISEVITFENPVKKGETITHRIYDIKVNEGIPIYITKGDANNAPDRSEVSKEKVIGKVLFSVPYLGYLINFIQKPLGFVLIILIPAAIIIGDEIRKIYAEIKKNKKE